MPNDSTQNPILVAFTTLPSQATATSMAHALLDEKLATCVSFTPITSIYDWEGKRETSEEVKLTIKSSPQLLHSLQKKVHELHPYALPEWWTLNAEASEGYAHWVRADSSQ